MLVFNIAVQETIISKFDRSLIWHKHKRETNTVSPEATVSLTTVLRMLHSLLPLQTFVFPAEIILTGVKDCHGQHKWSIYGAVCLEEPCQMLWKSLHCNVSFEVFVKRFLNFIYCSKKFCLSWKPGSESMVGKNIVFCKMFPEVNTNDVFNCNS